MNSRIDNAHLDWNENGTPVSNAFDDVYFSNLNGLAESRYVFLEQNHLPERWLHHDKPRFVIAETGFGTGLNFLAAWHAFKQHREQNPASHTTQLHFISFEKFPVTLADLKKAHESWPELAELATQLQAHYPPAVADCHRIVLEDGLITLDLWLGDIQDCLPQVWTGQDGIVDCWFLDGFAPSKNEAMWSQHVFNEMGRLARVACTTATFTAAGFVRRGLIEAGFEMKKVKGFGTKREMLAGEVSTRLHGASHIPWYAIKAATTTASTTTDNHANQSINSDVAIIGGGIASATAALSLARRGVNVTLYCADSGIAKGASGNRQGAVYPLLNNQFDALSRFFSTSFVYARQLAEQVNQSNPFAHEWCGVTQLRYDDKSEKKLSNLLDGSFSTDLVHGLSVNETLNKVGLDTACPAVFYPLGGWVCPQEMTASIIKHAINVAAQNGSTLTVITNRSLEKLSHNSVQWELTFADNKQASHNAVVIANGHQFKQIAQTSLLPATAVRGQVSHIPSNGSLNHLNTVLCYNGYLTPAHNGHHCIGASYDRNNEELAFSEQDQIDNKQRLVDCLPNSDWSQDISIADNHARVGIRCATRDHLPFVGAVCDVETLAEQYRDLQHNRDNANDVAIHPNLYCMVGLGSRGLSSAPLLGEIIASQINGDPLPLPQAVLDALHPGRMWVKKCLKGQSII